MLCASSLGMNKHDEECQNEWMDDQREKWTKRNAQVREKYTSKSLINKAVYKQPDKCQLKSAIPFLCE